MDGVDRDIQEEIRMEDEQRIKSKEHFKTEVEQKQHERRHKSPLLYCKFIVNYPKLAFGLTLGGHLVFTSITFILLGVGFDILPIEFRDFPLTLTKDDIFLREWAWRFRNQESDRVQRYTIDNIGPTWPRSYTVDNVELFYTQWNRNVFTKDNFQLIKSMEDEFYNLKDYIERFCQTIDNSGSCQKPKSILRYFDGTYSNLSMVFYDPYFENITGVLHEAYTNVNTRNDFRFFLGKNYRISKFESYSEITRTYFQLGWPLEGDNSTSEKHKMVEKFLFDTFKPKLLERRSSSSNGKMTLSFYSWKLFSNDVFDQALIDMMLAVGSLCFIFGFVWFQTGSLWITGWAVISIITSFWISNLLYRIVLDYRYFGYFHIIAIFIILGIGADDIFVFFNTWQASGHEKYPSLAHRISDCYRRAAGSMFFTSFTTMMAFLSGGMSPLLPLGSFGIFSGVLIAVNYISVIIFFPTVVITYHLYFANKICPCVTPCENKNKILDVKHKNKSKKKSVLVRFFSGPYFVFVTNKIVQGVTLVLFVGLISFFAYSTSNIEPDAEEIKLFKRSTNYGSAYHYRAVGFVPLENNFLSQQLVWGMHPRDLSQCHFTDHKCDGEQVWDEGFDLSLPNVQLALKNFCHLLKYGLSPEEISKLRISNNSITGERQVDCFMDNMEAFYTTPDNVLNNSIHLQLPYTENNIKDFMNNQTHIYEMDNLSEIFYRYFDIAVSYWLTNSYTMLSTGDFMTYNSLIGEQINSHSKQPLFHQALPNIYRRKSYYGTRLQYVIIQVNTTLNRFGLNHYEGLPVWQEWENFMKTQIKSMPPQLKSGFQTSEMTWHWLKIQETLTTNAILGIILGICIACPVLIIATGNFITGGFATVIIICITISVLGVIPLAGWKLDIMVCLNLCIVVGLSVDYVVHLAEGYSLSEHSDRLGRVKDMLEHLGISIVSGAFTTLGAASFMMFGQIQFFLQFGTFLFCTIGFSLVYALLVFTAIMALFGPQGDFGSIASLWKWVKYKCQGRKDTDLECHQCIGKGYVGQNDITISETIMTEDSSSTPNELHTLSYSDTTCEDIFDSHL